MINQKLIMLANMAKVKVGDFFADESGEVNIVTIVVLIGIAILLALLFKEQITNLLNTLFEAITGNATDAISNTPNGG